MDSVVHKNVLFDKDLVFTSDKNSKEEVLSEISSKLLNLGAVKEEFEGNLLTREANYPTGIDLSVISKDLPNVAIPHTEGEFVNTRLVVPVKLKNEVEFNNMINPDQKFKVKFLFMILNNNPNEQANILAMIMDFLTKTDVTQLQDLFESTDTNYIYDFLSKNIKEN